MRSLRARLVAVWAVSVAASAVLAVLLAQLYAQTEGALSARAELVAAQGCERLADRYAFYTAGWTGTAQALDTPTRAGLLAVARAAGTVSGLSVGFWHAGEGAVAAAPLALPAIEAATLDALGAQAVQQGTAHARLRTGGTQVLLLACPMNGPVADLVGWARVAVGEAPGLDRLRIGLGVLLALVLAVSAWLTWLVADWNRRVQRVAAGLAEARAPLPRTGVAELDRLVAALDAANLRLAAARERAAVNERLAALGRVAAGIAHEVRNPVAAMRLAAENALARDPALRGVALEAVLTQVARLDRLTGELLELTQLRPPQPVAVDLVPFLAELTPAARTEVATWRFDPVPVRRILAILLDNAARHAPGAPARLTATAEEGRLHLVVEDDGPGVAPTLRASLFEPFVTGSAEGTGLGLAIALELAQGQGGTLRLDTAAPGARFVLELPLPPPEPGPGPEATWR